MEVVGAVALVAGVFLVDHAAVFVAPRLLSRIAFLRAGPDRSVPIPLHAAEALAEPAGAASSYRAAPAVRYEAARLAGPEIVQAGDAHMIFVPERAEILARQRLRGEGAGRGGGGRASSLVRVRLKIEPDRIVLRATYHPSLALGAIVAGLTAALGFQLDATILVGLLVSAWVLAMVLGSRVEARTLLAAVETEVANRVATLEPRVAPAPLVEPDDARTSEPPSDRAAHGARSA